MTTTAKIPIRLVPAVRGIFGTWIYYSAMLKLRDVAEHVSTAEEIHPNKKLSEMIQRELNRGRAKEISDYLCNQKERFLNSLVIAVYGGEPEWYALGDIQTGNVDFDASRIDEEELASVGFLQLSGEETFFALDGQHRLAGIRKALKNDESLEEDEINVLFVAHKETTEGRQRTRRLFTTLNKRAKPVSKRAIIALDEDDTMAIACRRLVEEHEWFKGDRIAYQATNNMPTSNKSSLTTLGALYDVLYGLFHNAYGEERDALKFYRPSDKDLDNWYGTAVKFFECMRDSFPAFREFCEAGKDFAEVTEIYRNENGGSVLFRPIGLVLLVDTIANLWNAHKDAGINDVLEHLSRIDWSLNTEPFVDNLWDSEGHRMETGTRVLCRDLILYVCGEGTVKDSAAEKYIKKKGVSKSAAYEYLDNLNCLEPLKDA